MGTDDINPFMGKDEEISLWDLNCYNISTNLSLRIKNISTDLSLGIKKTAKLLIIFA